MSLVCLIYLRKVLLNKSNSEIAKPPTSSIAQPLESSPNWKQDFMEGLFFRKRGGPRQLL